MELTLRVETVRNGIKHSPPNGLYPSIPGRRLCRLLRCQQVLGQRDADADVGAVWWHGKM
jgi:hypothetical protein